MRDILRAAYPILSLACVRFGVASGSRCLTMRFQRANRLNLGVLLSTRASWCGRSSPGRFGSGSRQLPCQ